MKYKTHVSPVVLLTAIFFLAAGHPIINSEENLVNKDEERYPNGTVMGKYTYTDNEGNPVHVKYFADDTSYGVELKSIKVVSEPLGTEYLKNPLKITEHPFEPPLDPFTGFKELLNSNRNYSNDVKQPDKIKTKGDQNDNNEFEILTQNELKAPEKCGKNKVKVYFDKDKRKTRDIKIDLDSMNYCDRV